MTRPLVEILLPTPFNYGFSYFVPEGLELEIGDVVKVPFRSKEMFGVVVSRKSLVDSGLDERKIKTVIGVEEKIKFSAKLLEFIDFVAAYNLAPKGLVLKLSLAILNSSKEVKRKKLVAEKLIKIALKSLNENQQKAADLLLGKVAERKFSTILLDGITGSGKTEVYFQGIAQILSSCHPERSEGSLAACREPKLNATHEILRYAQDDNTRAQDDNTRAHDNNINARNDSKTQILILLPEIALTSQLCKRFKQQFGFEPDLWHSKISPSKKRELFFRIANGSCRVLIGARSALFLPFKNLQLIVVDEEHDSSFKQEDIVNYHGRDMAIMRAKLENIPIILSSATPSLESYLHAQNEKYQLIKLDQRFGQEEKTAINLLDMRQEKLLRDQFISTPLKNLLEENLKNNRQSLLFLNRRGYAPLTLCKKCGQKVSCKNCSSYLTFHQKSNRLICHHCGVSSKVNNVCNNCGEKDCLINCGVGVEKLQEEVLRYFPEARIGLMTSDNIKNNDDAKNLIEQILEHKIDIIIGTQMIAKGHHFPSLALVGIIDGDGSFLGGNLRTLERSFQLLTQVIGRAGRENFAGQVVLQTYNPENSVFKNIIENKRDEFLEGEIKGRQAMNFPPFSKMAAIIFSGIDENLVVDFAKFVLRKFPVDKNIEIFGPAPLAITRVKNRYHYCLNIKVDRKINLQKLIKDCFAQIKTPAAIRVKIDIDPI
ncbi:MAG: primosomal protein N' [Pseudomonadota bacterium]